MSKLPRPFERWSTYPGHGGIDYPYPRGTAVLASGPGYIDWSGYYSARGGYAKFITYDCGCRHGYYHFDREQGLPRGSRVDLGTAFALVGGLGQKSTGPHLHHEVWDGHSSIIRPPAYWDYVDVHRYVGPPEPDTKEYPDMFIANVKNGNFWLCLAGQPAVLLGASSGARASGIPILNFPDDWAVSKLKAAFPNIT